MAFTPAPDEIAVGLIDKKHKNVKNNNMQENNTSSRQRFDFYSTREAARELGVSVTTIQLWVESGALSAWKTAGGHRRIPREAIDAMRAKQQSLVEDDRDATLPSVLVVDDDPVQRELYRIKFDEWGLPIQLYLAQDGFEGLLMAGKYSPALIIADLSMPGMDGFEMIRHLVKSEVLRTTKLIVVTAFSAAEVQTHGGLPEGIAVYRKPVVFGAIKPLIERSLRVPA